MFAARQEGVSGYFLGVIPRCRSEGCLACIGTMGFVPLLWKPKFQIK